ncbi:MAG: glycogen/starch/alpha-glucan phosphorylase [Methylococcales bacterium]|nr:glycogen/starch/alpha-glucan phosphorylase [Methylococcales bacterium]
MNTATKINIYDYAHTGLSKEALKHAFFDNLFYVQGKFPALATQHDYYLALAYTVRDRLLHCWISTAETYTRQKVRTVAYFSAEFLVGPHLGNNLLNLGITEQVRQALPELNLIYEELLRQEEKTDKWLRYGNPWEIQRPEWAIEVKLGGHTERYVDATETMRVRWIPGWTVLGTPYDTPILGYHNNTANTLRLWKAEAAESFDLAHFNRGDYYGAVQKKLISENITKILYPNDEQIQGKELRLLQQYFFVSCSLQDMIRIMHIQKIPLTHFHEKFTVQLNDTHPAVAIPELMRLLIDEHLNEVRIQFLGDSERLARLSIINESEERYVRMAHLASVGSHAINGVAALHTELLKKDVLADFYNLWPNKFSNKTNGITPRRWLALSNPRLTKLISEKIGCAGLSHGHADHQTYHFCRRSDKQ